MAITYGMSVKEFWEDNPDLFWAYRFSYYEKIKFEQELFNQKAWLQGNYICEAVHVAINNCFSKQKIEYTKAPYGTDKKLVQETEIKNQQDILVAKLKNRVAQVKAIKGEDKK